VNRYYTQVLQHCEACYPAFNTPYFEEFGTSSKWVEITFAGDNQ
jgi:hypothetical protein